MVKKKDSRPTARQRAQFRAMPKPVCPTGGEVPVECLVRWFPTLEGARANHPVMCNCPMCVRMVLVHGGAL